MEIASQNIQTVGGQSGPLLTIIAGLKPGDLLTAQVLGRSPAGLALVALAGKQVQLPLPTTFLPGTVLTLTVQEGKTGLQFVVEPQAASGQAASARAAPTGEQTSLPQTASTATAARAAPASIPTPSGQSLQPPLVNARTGLPVPAPPGATPGQMLTAQIISTPTASTAIVSLGAQELPVSLQAPAQPGTVLPLVVQSGPNGLQIAHAPPSATLAPATPSSPAAATAPPGQVAAGASMPTIVPPATSPTTVPILAQAMLASLGNQNSVATLVSSVLRLGERLRELPSDVQRAVQRLAQVVLPLDGKAPDAAALQRAIARSGVFLELSLAAGAGDMELDGDLKALLLTVRRTLGEWLGDQARPTALAGKQPPPPLAGQAPRASLTAPGAPLADDSDIEDIGKSLLSQTDAALSRLRLHQIASLPDRPEGATLRHDVRLEVPITIGQQPGVLSLVISRDPDEETEEKQQKNWRVQFAVNASVIGEVGAEIGLLAGRTNVVLSAAEPGTAEALNEGIPDLSLALEAVGLTPGVLRVRRANPAQPPAGFQPVATVSSGRLLDRDT